MENLSNIIHVTDFKQTGNYLQLHLAIHISIHFNNNSRYVLLPLVTKPDYISATWEQYPKKNKIRLIVVTPRIKIIKRRAEKRELPLHKRKEIIFLCVKLHTRGNTDTFHSDTIKNAAHTKDIIAMLPLRQQNIFSTQKNT